MTENPFTNAHLTVFRVTQGFIAEGLTANEATLEARKLFIEEYGEPPEYFTPDNQID